VGKVYCKVDADAGPIAVGDLLTSSNTVGHAMRVSDLGFERPSLPTISLRAVYAFVYPTTPQTQSR
jgi:hypothetical protein